MDTQLKKGLLEICILTVLKKEDSYGYQIIKDISDYIEISESTLYPILRRLETNAFLKTYSVEHSSRLRKYYCITKAGRIHIDVFLEDWKEVMKIYNFIKAPSDNESQVNESQVNESQVNESRVNESRVNESQVNESRVNELQDKKSQNKKSQDEGGCLDDEG